MASQPGPTEAENALSRAKAAVLRERASELLADSANAGDAGLWGDTIQRALVEASLALQVDAARIDVHVH